LFYHYLAALGFACLLISFLIAQNLQALREKKPLVMKNALGLYALLLFLFFCIDAYSYFVTPQFAMAKSNAVFARLIDIMNSGGPDRSLVCFSLDSTECFRIVGATGMEYKGRFPFFWWYRGMKKHLQATPILSPTLQAHTNYLRDAVSADLKNLHPHWLLIHNFDGHRAQENKHFMKFFSVNNDFRSTIQKYHFVTAVEYYDVYEYREGA
jgi:hypothetical protein